jgi:hypothetical protein
MTQLRELPYGGLGTVHVDYAAAITARMPTSQECERGYPAGTPVLVVTRPAAGLRGEVVSSFPSYITVTVDGPHVQPNPSDDQKATSYVLGVIAEELGLVADRVEDLAAAAGSCGVVHLAAKVREERDEGTGTTMGREPDVIYPVTPAT